jgi:hypothetical protein
MKRFRAIAACLALALLLGGCDVVLGPQPTTGNLVISLGEGNASRAVVPSDEVKATLRYELRLSGPETRMISDTLFAGETFNEQVTLGNWEIYVEAYTPDDRLIGVGSAAVTVKPGANRARVQMELVSTVDSLVLDSLVTAPVKDVAPVATDIDTAQYAGTVVWQTADGAAFTGATFAPSTAYQAVVSLTAKPGYTFGGFPENGFSYAGATVTNPAGSGNAITVTISFPATAAPGADTLATARALDGLVTAPVNDTAPVATAINTAQYTGTVAWQTTDGSAFTGATFAPSTAYQAVVALTAKTGYTFEGFSAGSGNFSYSGAVTVTNTVGSGGAITVTIVFPATASAITTQSITVSFNDDGSGAFSQGTFAVKQNGAPGELSTTITLQGSWTNGEWRVDGFVKAPAAASFTVTAADYTVGAHTLQVTVRNGTGPYWSKTLPFKVTAAVTGISVNKTALTLPAGGTETLFATASPANAENRTVTWASDNTAVATVNGGVVSALAAGSATITATAGGFTASCAVMVTTGGDQGISVSFSDGGSGAFSQGTFVVNKSSSPATQNVSLVGSWASQEWRVDGFAKGSAGTFVVDAADYPVGAHTLQVTVEDSAGAYWSKTLSFTVGP